ncbi:MAG: transketolase C-terminal domain-containing protein [Blastochloris sp.]|nr:transketolase C-terminal domain-containing protein [Blastochloris sp.]
MAVDNSVVTKVDAPALKLQAPQSRLAPAPQNPPKYFVKIKNTAGQETIVADPSITRALVALMNVHAVNGGAACHWGGPAALAEVMASIHAIMFSVKGRPWFDAFNFVNDAGHTENGIYAVRANYGFDHQTFAGLRDFRSIKSKLTGHGESHLNPEGVLLSNGPLGSSLPQAQGLAIGDHFAQNDRVTLCVLSDGAAMEGEAKESFAAIPGLAARGLVNPFVLILSDNDTKLSGRITAQSFSMQGSFASFALLGWEVVQVPNGNNLQEVYLATEKAIALAQKNPAKPVVLWLKTVKGFGIKKTVEDASGGHGFPLSNAEKIIDWLNEITANQPPAELLAWAEELRKSWSDKEAAKAAQPASSAPVVKKSKIQAGLSDGAIKAAKEGLPVFSVAADLAGSTGMSAFQKTFPDRSIDIGIAESNMVSTAAGMSKIGFIPIVDTFAQFGVTKGNLPLTMAALSQAPVVAVFSHAGFQDAADGASHQATTYIAATSSIPHTAVVVLSCASEAEAYMYQAIKRIAEARKINKDGETVIFFLGRENYPISWQDGAQYQWGKAQVLREGKDVTIIANGALVGNALKAADKLKEKGVSAAVINNAFVNQIDIETISRVVQGTGGKLVTVDDHQVIGGSGAQVIHALVQADVSIRAKSLGIQGEFGQSAYMADELYEKHGLGASGIMAAAEALLK